MTNVSARRGWIAILHDELRLRTAPLPRARRTAELEDVRNPLIAQHAAIGTIEKEHGCSGARAMKRILFVCGILVLMMGANSVFAQVQTCGIITGGDAGGTGGVRPSYLASQDGRANEGCTVLITLYADGTITTTTPNPAFSYENGDDDNMIGVVNNLAIAIPSIQLSSPTAPIFGFDGDGICGGLPGMDFQRSWTAAQLHNRSGSAPLWSGANYLHGNDPVQGDRQFRHRRPCTRYQHVFQPWRGQHRCVGLQVKIPDPVLVFRKSGPATMTLGQWGAFGLDVQNTGGSDAWNVNTIVDKLPTGATGGMCTTPPQILSAPQVFLADGVTPVPGKGPLAAGTDYTVSYAGAPTCTLTLNHAERRGGDRSDAAPHRHLPDAASRI